MEEIPYTYSCYLSICNFISNIDKRTDNIIDYYLFYDIDDDLI